MLPTCFNHSTLTTTVPRLSLFLLLSFFVVSAHAQPVSAHLEVPGVSYATSIPTPASVIGHEIGMRHTVPHQVVEYFRAVDAASDRVTVHTHAYSYEGRPLIHALVTSPANHRRLEAIRAANQRLSDAPGEVSNADIQQMPAVVYMGYSVHGNEASGTEAGILLLHHLAAGQGASLEALLDSMIVIIDPMLNPDGRDRFGDWANRNRGGIHTTDPQDREHREAWPGGRTNHYWFDLNRDWLPVQHPESQGRIQLFHEWRPQVLTDFHEMGGNSTYFFQPGIPSRTNHLTPPLNQQLTGEIADFHARILDGIGSLYYTRESFDDFYYGKGSTYPDVNGTIGILFEQASSRALETDVNDGPLHYAYTVRNQYATSLSSLEAVQAMRTKLLRYQRDFYAGARDFARREAVKAYVLDADRSRTRTQHLVGIMLQHRVQVYELAQSLSQGGTTYTPGSAYVVPIDQPQARLVKAMMERNTTFTDSLFYDVSAWTLPLAFDIDYAEVRQNASRYVGAQVTEAVMDGGRLVGGPSSVGYLMKWNRYYAPQVLYALQAAGVHPRVIHQPFSARIQGQTMAFPRGTVMIPAMERSGEIEGLFGMLQDLVAQYHVELFAVESGLTPTGPDLGGSATSVLQQPKVALLSGSGTSAYNTGEAWHLLTERFKIPVSLLDVDNVGSADLDRYTHVVMPGGFYGGLDADKLKEWVRRGGVLVASSSGADWAVRNEFADLERKSLELDSLTADQPYDQVGTIRGAQVVGGAIYAARFDTTHPVAYGLPAEMALFRRGTTFYEKPDAAGTTVAVYAARPLMAGYSSEPVLEKAAGSAAVVARGMGRGNVVLLMDNPNFRAFWYGTNRLFLNAIFLGGSF